MKFLIQKINGKITHDFSFTLLKSIEYQNWLHRDSFIKFKYFNTICPDGENFKYFEFNSSHKNYVPVGSVEFVIVFLEKFYGLTPKPLNVPEELFDPYYSSRPIFNENNTSLKIYNDFKWFVKSNDKIKGFSEIIKLSKPYSIPEGNYQISEYINIYSEWRAFIYNGKLVGLQNYSAEFTKFPDINKIHAMIKAYKSAPVAYTLDVGIDGSNNTFVIECHDFFSCGLYGFADHRIYPQMLYKWFKNYINKK
jgi:hypothetical protein